MVKVGDAITYDLFKVGDTVECIWNSKITGTVIEEKTAEYAQACYVEGHGWFFAWQLQKVEPKEWIVVARLKAKNMTIHRIEHAEALGESVAKEAVRNKNQKSKADFTGWEFCAFRWTDGTIFDEEVEKS